MTGHVRAAERNQQLEGEHPPQDHSFASSAFFTVGLNNLDEIFAFNKPWPPGMNGSTWSWEKLCVYPPQERFQIQILRSNAKIYK